MAQSAPNNDPYHILVKKGKTVKSIVIEIIVYGIAIEYWRANWCNASTTLNQY